MRKIVLLLAVTMLLISGSIIQGGASENTRLQIKLERHNGGFFSIDKPRGWPVVTAGACSSFAFLIRDPQDPLRQIFYFGQVGPVYMVARQKRIDRQYMSMGGYAVPWFEMPVICPFTPENFLKQFHAIACTRIARQFMPQCPSLDGLNIISVTPQQGLLAGAATGLIRALFKQDGRLGEGLFLVTVAPLIPFSGNPGGGIGYGFLFTGVTAPKREFRTLVGVLTKSVRSFNVHQSYVQNCMRQQAATYAGIMKAGQTLSRASDMIMSGWEKRNRVDDIMAEKRSDAILGKERLYDPDTKEVYEFEQGFYDRYNLNRQRYEMNNLQLLPSQNHELWMRAPLDGSRHLR